MLVQGRPIAWSAEWHSCEVVVLLREWIIALSILVLRGRCAVAAAA